MERLGIAHERMLTVWRDLLSRVEERRLQPAALEAFRLYLLRHWSSPAARPPQIA